MQRNREHFIDSTFNNQNFRPSLLTHCQLCRGEERNLTDHNYPAVTVWCRLRNHVHTARPRLA